MKESSHTLTNVSLRLLRIEAFSFLFIIPFTAYIFISQKNDRKHILELQEAILSIQDAQDTRLNQIETNFISPYKQVIEGEGRVDDLSLQKLSYQTKPTRTESYLSLPSRKVFEKNQKLPLPSRLSGKNKSTILQGSFFLPVEEGLAQLEKDAMTLDIKLEEEKVASTSINYLSKIHKTTHENSAAFSLLKKGESRHLKDSHSATINKNLARNNITPNCMNFTMRIELDDQASETMWTLIDDKEHLVIANYTYSDEKSNSAYTYNLCLVPSQFTLTIFDSDGDGIDCRSKLKGESISCYSYWINGEFKEGINFSSVSKHAIDTNRRCLLGPMVLLKLHFSTDDIHSDFTLLNTETGHTDYEFFQTTDAKLHSNTTETYYICVKPGMYEITLKGTNSTGGSFTCDNSCYDISIEHNPIIVGPSILDESPVSFYVNTEWTTRERICHKQPILAAINDVSNFMFDDRAFKILNILQAISSLENLILPGKDQHKAACFVLYDDANYVRAEDSFLLQRYTLALFLYATNQSAELHLLSNPCLSDKYSCNEMNEITRIDFSRNGLGGVIKREIAHFTKLESLILNDNQFSGTIPREIAKLRNLNVLEASGNNLTGNLPSTIGLMQNLDNILLHDNKISNTIPSKIGNLSNLRYLRLGTNELIGSIPPEIFAHTNLTFFDVSNNKLT